MSNDPKKEKSIARKLPCGGYAIYTNDIKTKTLMQTGYIGSNLKLEAWLPEGTVIEK